MSVEALESFVGQMTVAELCQRTGHSVEDLLAFCSNGRSAQVSTSRPATKSNSKSKGKSKAKAKSAGKTRRTRANSDQLAALDGRIMGLISSAKDGVGGRELADKTGEELPRVRGSLKRLVAMGSVRFAGNTAARRYWTK